MESLIQKRNIEDMIYEIRGKQVMLDSDLAKLYECKNGTKEINQSVDRNCKKFPERYSWRLSDEEVFYLRSQFVTTNINNKSRVNPRVFTEEGVAMLATILKSKVATEVSIKIMDTFVNMRKYISSGLLEQQYYKNLVLEDHSRINFLEESFDKFKEKQKISTIFFEGQIYDAYSLLVDILKEAKEEIVIIDNYIDKTILDIVSLLEVKTIFITNKYNKLDIQKYQEQYDNIIIQINNFFHDRFLIIDRKVIYHSGASFKDIGKKCFALTKMEDTNYIQQMVQKIEE